MKDAKKLAKKIKVNTINRSSNSPKADMIKKGRLSSVKVSVIVAVYNAEKYLKQCMDSIIGQTLKDIEIICVNDGSTDKSYAILKKYKRIDKRVKIINKENGGAGAARNEGLKFATGEYLSFLDSDDFFEPDMLESAYNAACTNKADIVLFECDFFDNQKETFEKKTWTIRKKQLPENNPFSPKDVGDNIFSFTVGWAWDKLFKRSLIVENNILFYDKNILEDAHFTCQACAVANSIYYLDKILIHYRNNVHGSLSNSANAYINSVMSSIQSMKDGLIANGVYEQYERPYLNRVVTACHSVFAHTSGDERKKFYNEIYNIFSCFGLFDRDINFFLEKRFYEFVRKIKLLNYDEFCIDKEFLEKNPKFIQLSIIIPVYNVEEYLEQCINSVISQPLSDIEVICVDDGSTDRSLDILHKLEEKDKRILVIHQENKNAGAARNTALKFAHGKFIHFLDADDWVEENAYSKVFEILNSRAPEICVCWHKDFNNVTKQYNEIKSFSLDYRATQTVAFKDKYKFFSSNHVVPWNKIYRRDYILSLNAQFDEIYCANDRTFYFYTMFNAEKIVLYAEYLTVHRINNSLSLAGGGRRKHFDCHIYANKLIMRYAENLSDDIKQFMVRVNLGDVFRWFYESDRSTVNQNYGLVLNFYDELIAPYGLEEFRDASWYANAKIATLSRETRTYRNVVTIAFIVKAVDAPYFDVTLISLIFKMSSKYYYDIYVLDDGCFNYETQRRLEKHKGVNYRVKRVNIRSSVQKYIKGAAYNKYFFDCARLIIPELFCFDDYILTFEGALIFNDDVAKMLSIDLSGSVVGAVPHFVTKTQRDKIVNNLYLRGDKYFNPQVLVYNIGEFLSSSVKSDGMSLLQKESKNIYTPDLIFSTACRSNNIKISLLDSGWNFQVHANVLPENTLSDGTLHVFRNARGKRYIINFDNDKKPWMYPEGNESIYFWQYASKSEWYDIIKQISLIERIQNMLNVTCPLNCSDIGKAINNGNKPKNKKRNKFGKKKNKSGFASVILWPFTKIKRGFRSLKNNSFRYTIKGRAAAQNKSRFASVILWPFTTIKRIFRSLKNNGFRYTIIRLLKGRAAAQKFLKGDK